MSRVDYASEQRGGPPARPSEWGLVDWIRRSREWAEKARWRAQNPKCPYCVNGMVYFAVDRSGAVVCLDRTSGTDEATRTRLTPVVCTCSLATARGLRDAIIPKTGKPYRLRTMADLTKRTGFTSIEHHVGYATWAAGKLGIDVEELLGPPDSHIEQGEFEYSDDTYEMPDGIG